MYQEFTTAKMTREEAIRIFSVGFERFLERSGLTLEAAGQIMDSTKGNASRIKQKKGLPSVEGLFSLVENGMTLEEIFGADLAKKLVESYKIEGADVENIDIFKELPNPAGMTEEEFDQKLKGSLKRLLGNLDIK